MATFNLSNEIQIVNPSANVDSHYGTYASLSDAYIGVPEILREKGKTVGVLESGDVVEYWWKSGITDIDLVKKETSIPISGTTNTIPKFDALGLVDSQIVDDGTNVTIGGGSTFEKFNVNGTIYCKTAVLMQGSSSDFSGYDSDGVLLGQLGFNKFIGAKYGTYTNLPIRFIQNATEAARISDNQNFLIGTTVDTGQKLQVEGDALINGLTVGRGGGNVASNLVIGVNSFTNNVNGDYNTAIGVESLMSNQSGGSNVAIGPNSLRENTTGSSNTAIGGGSLYSNQTGGDNVAIGEDSLYSSMSGQNVAIGKASLRTTGSGHDNIGIGYMAWTLDASDSNSIVIGNDALGAGSNTVVLGNNSITRTNLKGDVHFPMSILDALESPGSAGQILSSTNTGIQWIIPQQNGLYAQTALSTPVVYASGEASLIGAGVGTLSVPANAFKVGDSFVAKMCGILTCANNEILHIRVRSNGVLIIDALQYTLATTTDKYYDLILDFTVTKLGGVGVAELFANGIFTYNKNASVAMEGVHFGQISNTVFDTTVNNSLTITAEWVTSSATNTIRSQNFTLTKVY